MKKFPFVALTAVAVVAVWSAVQAADLKSGPQPGSEVPGAFEPFNLNGPSAGEESCLYCRYGKAPVVMIFARSQSAGLTKLIEKVEAATAGTKEGDVGACVVYLDTADATKSTAKKLADEKKLKTVILSCIKPVDIEDYKIAADADVTVLLYSKRTVRANHAFKAGELTEASVEKVLADLPKIMPAK